MNIWKVLQIDKTSDKKAIKNAYRTQLKITHPEEKPEEFMQLRMAYEEALEYAENAYEEWAEDIFEDEEYEDAYEDEESCDFEDEDDYSEDDYDVENGNLVSVDLQEVRAYNIQIEVDRWWRRVSMLWADFARRCDVNEWKVLLYEDIPYQITYYDKCRQRIHAFLLEDTSKTRYLPEAVWKLLDHFFSFAPNKLELFTYALRLENKKLKLGEIIDFTKVMVNNEYDADRFFKAYERMCTLLPLMEEDNYREEVQNLRKKLDGHKLIYLPYECMKLALHFEQLKEQELEEKISEFECLFGKADELELLKAQYRIFKGEINEAQKRLKELYRTIPLKNYPLIYQMALCCEQVSMNFEAYMLTKQLSWLHPEKFMEVNAERIYETMEADYQRKVECGHEVSDLERIHICRMYLRSNREKDALRILHEVAEPEADEWNYHVARCLCYFNEDDIDPMQDSWKKLELYDKQILKPIEQLEWEELKARYLFEQKKYAECIDKCNELLEEYPVSFTILTLRGYADYSLKKKNKSYLDFYYLKSVFPKRVEVLLMMAQLARENGRDELICELLEDVKDKCPEIYEYGKIAKDRSSFSDNRKKAWINLFAKVKNQEVNIPAVSKYGGIDLNLLYRLAALSLFHQYDEKVYKKLKSLLVNLKKSNFNHPEKYVNLTFLYRYTEENRLAIKNGLDWLRNAQNDGDRIWCCELLLERYGEIGDIEGLEKLWTQTEDLMLSMDGLENHRRMYSSALWAYRAALSKYDEKWYRRVEDIGLKLKKMARSVSDYHAISVFYDTWGDVTGDVSKYLKAIELWKEYFSVFGRVGDFTGNNENVHLIMAKLYAKAGMKKEALFAVEDMKKYAKNESIINDSYMYIAEVYELLEEFELAGEYYVIAEEHGSWIINKVLRYYLKAGKYRQAYNIYMDEPDARDLVYAIHTKYMEGEVYDRTELLGIQQKLLEDVADGKLSADEVGDCYTCLVDICNALGDVEQEVYYRQRASKHKWDSHLDRDVSILRSELWILWYKKQYQKAWELLCENRHCFVFGEPEVEMFRYKLSNMFCKN